jgi:hypothetical protein
VQSVRVTHNSIGKQHCAAEAWQRGCRHAAAGCAVYLLLLPSLVFYCCRALCCGCGRNEEFAVVSASNALCMLLQQLQRISNSCEESSNMVGFSHVVLQ